MNEFMALCQALLKYINSDNIESFISMIENLVKIAEDVKDAADKSAKGK